MYLKLYDIEPQHIDAIFLLGTLYLQSGKPAPATAFGSASVTGSLTGSVIAYDGVVAAAFTTLDARGAVVLNQNDEIAVTAASTGTVYVTILGHFKDI